MSPEVDPTAESPEMRRARAPLEQADASVPYRIDWIDGPILGDRLPGRLGLTFLPGKHGTSFRYPGLVYGRDLDRDLAAMRAAGVEVLVLLVEDAELAAWGDPAIVERAAGAGIRVRRHPWPDGGTPASTAEMAALLGMIRADRATGNVAVACMGGVGRTGLVAACALVDAGFDAGAAIAEVRRIRHPDAVETEAQAEFVTAYARRRV